MGPRIIVGKTLKNNKVEGLTFPDCKNYCKATVIKKAAYWHQIRSAKQSRVYK